MDKSMTTTKKVSEIEAKLIEMAICTLEGLILALLAKCIKSISNRFNLGSRAKSFFVKATVKQPPALSSTV